MHLEEHEERQKKMVHDKNLKQMPGASLSSPLFLRGLHILRGKRICLL